jgi:hypothetical protein
MAFSMKAPKPPKFEDKDLFEMPKDDLFEPDNFEVDNDFIEAEKQHDSFVQKQKETKKKEESYSIPTEDMQSENQESQDSFSVEKEQQEEESLYKVPDQEVFEEINSDLRSEDLPMKVIAKDKIEVTANGEKHFVSRNDLINYKKNYDLEDGESRPFTRFVQLGTIKGERAPMDSLSKDIHKTFSDVDNKLGGVQTLEDND